MLKGIETTVYFVDDLEAATAWYQDVLGVEPNHVSEYYVGFTVAGYELGLHPMGEDKRRQGVGEPTAYWSVDDVEVGLEHFFAHGAEPCHEVTEVGGGVRFATVFDPYGNEFGLIENPNSPNA